MRCKDPHCSASTGICGAITYGTGELDEWGYWQFSCRVCTYLDDLNKE